METGSNYSPNSDVTQFGIDDAANECFEIPSAAKFIIIDEDSIDNDDEPFTDTECYQYLNSTVFTNNPGCGEFDDTSSPVNDDLADPGVEDANLQGASRGIVAFTVLQIIPFGEDSPFDQGNDPQEIASKLIIYSIKKETSSPFQNRAIESWT